MYLYFDRNLVLKEIINDKALRQGNYDVNKLYVYIDNPDNLVMNTLWVKYLLPDGTLLLAFEVVTKVTEELPYNPKQDLKFFKYGKPYVFFEVPTEITVDNTVHSALEQAGTVACSLSIDGTNYLGLVAFNVEESVDGMVIAPEEYLTLAQFSYLLGHLSEYLTMTTTPNKLYGTNGVGEYYLYDVGGSALPYYVVRRTSNGGIVVPQEPSTNVSATSKYYVDHNFVTKLDIANDSTMTVLELLDASHMGSPAAGILCVGNKTYHYFLRLQMHPDLSETFYYQFIELYNNNFYTGSVTNSSTTVVSLLEGDSEFETDKVSVITELYLDSGFDSIVDDENTKLTDYIEDQVAQVVEMSSSPQTLTNHIYNLLKNNPNVPIKYNDELYYKMNIGETYDTYVCLRDIHSVNNGAVDKKVRAIALNHSLKRLDYGETTQVTFYNKSQTDDLLSSKQNVLTFDNTPTAGSLNPVTSGGIKSAIDSAVSSVYKYKGSVASYSDLPSTGLTIGDVYNVEDTGDNYAWNGSAWDKLAGTIDLSGYQPLIDYSHKLSADLVENGTTNKVFTTTEQTKLSGIESGAQVNVLDGVQVGGIDLTITNKKVNIELMNTTTDIEYVMED